MFIAKLPWRQPFPKCHPYISVLRLRTVRYISQSFPFPTIERCPPCNDCLNSTPSVVGIDHEKPLSGTTPPYRQHVVICTGRDDWASRIEKEEGPNLAKGLKELVGPKGEFHDPYNNIMITNSSFPISRSSDNLLHKTQPRPYSQEQPSSSSSDSKTSPPPQEHLSAYLFPSFQYIPNIPNTPSGHRAFVQNHLLPANPNHSNPPPAPSLLHPIILICGHGTRDRRCGEYGPILRAEFQHHLSPKNPRTHHVQASTPADNVALISHIGGHAFAGNVIIYLPPGFRHVPSPPPPPPSPSSSPSSASVEISTPPATAPPPLSNLAGTGIWYGRVEPKHVAGIWDATVARGTVITELFRGGVTADGEVLRL